LSKSCIKISITWCLFSINLNLDLDIEISAYVNIPVLVNKSICNLHDFKMTVNKDASLNLLLQNV